MLIKCKALWKIKDDCTYFYRPSIEKWGLCLLPLSLCSLWGYFDQQFLAEVLLCQCQGLGLKEVATATPCFLEHSLWEL